MKKQIVLPFSFGVLTFLILIVLSLAIPYPTDFQFKVFATLLALGAGGVAAAIPGFVDLKGSIPQVAFQAGGGLAVFVLVLLIHPLGPDDIGSCEDNLTNRQLTSGALSLPRGARVRLEVTPYNGARVRGSVTLPAGAAVMEDPPVGFTQTAPRHWEWDLTEPRGQTRVLSFRLPDEQPNYDVHFGSLSVGNMIAGVYGASNANFSITSAYLKDGGSRLHITPADLFAPIAGYDRRVAELQVTWACD